jgi:hypothetical protein
MGNISSLVRQTEARPVRRQPPNVIFLGLSQHYSDFHVNWHIVTERHARTQAEIKSQKIF